MALRLSILLAGFIPALVAAQESRLFPRLHIETGMHMAKIGKVAADRSGRLALTVSVDKTARLWELPGGRLLRTLLPPVTDRNEGKLYAGALHPDGTLAAASGWTGVELRGDTCVYVFDTATGQVAKRLVHATPTTVTDLAFSPSGRLLAGVASAGAGLAIWNLATGSLMANDPEYDGHESNSVSWSGEDKLVTACMDGHVRLYQLDSSGTLKLLKKAKPAGGTQPLVNRFCPDGRTIAVSFDDTKAVTLLNASDLSFSASASTAGINNGKLSKVCWTQDGSTLVAGGDWNLGSGATGLRSWTKAGRGKFSDTAAGYGNIFGLLALPDGGILYTTSEPSWGVTGPSGNRDVLVRSRLTSFDGEKFRIASDGGTVAFPLPGSNLAARFSVHQRQLIVGTPESGYASPKGGWSKPVKVKLDLIGWNTPTPKIAGRTLALKTYEDSRCIAVARDSASFVLGTNWYLRSFTSKGELRWENPVTAPSINAILVDNDRLLVSSFEDGTVRWFRVSDGEEILAYFLQPESRHWAVWANGSVYSTEKRKVLGVLGTRSQNGLVLDVVVKDSPASRAGLLRGDVIHHIGSSPILQTEDLQAAVKQCVAGEALQVRFERQGKPMELKVAPAEVEQKILSTRVVYYDCSPGGEDLLNWHVNREADQAADLFPVSRFRPALYRPDVIRDVLKSRDVTAANKALGRTEEPADIPALLARLSPPVVELETGGVFREVVLPSDASSFNLRYGVRQTSTEPTTDVEIRANGRPLGIDAPVPATGGKSSITVPLPPGFQGEISVLASHALGRSAATTLRVRRENPATSVTPAPKLHVLSVGAAQLAMNAAPDLPGAAPKAGAASKDQFLNLDFAASDARQVAAVLSTQQGKAFSEVHTTVLLNDQATSAAVRKAMEHIADNAAFGDVILFFFSGHGNHDPKTGRFHLVTYDTDPMREGETAFSGDEMSQILGRARAYVVVALDACHSGAVLGMQQGEKYKAPALDISGLANQLSSAEHGIAVLSSSTPDQFSFEDRVLGGGLFTKALVEGLQGKASKDGTATFETLKSWIEKRVPELSVGDSPKGKLAAQTPITVLPPGVPEIILAKP